MVKSFSRLLYVCSLAGLFLLPACIQKNRDYLKKFPRITKYDGVVKSNENITVRVKAYSSADSKRYFKKDLVRAGYKPIQVNIENNSKDSYVLRPSYIGLDLVPSNRIARLLYDDSIMNAVYIYYAGILGVTFINFYFLPLFAFSPLYGWMSHKSNKKINKNLRFNSVQDWQDGIVIHPYASINKFIFTSRSSYHGSFSLKLFNESERRLDSFEIIGLESVLSSKI